MPATAAAYGLDDPFDAEAAIDAQAHLMSDLLEPVRRPVAGARRLQRRARRRSPPATASRDYPETQAYVARILGLHGRRRRDRSRRRSRCGW